MLVENNALDSFPHLGREGQDTIGVLVLADLDLGRPV